MSALSRSEVRALEECESIIERGLASFIEVAITGFDVLSARTISSSFITFAGEKKCRPITNSGRLVTDAIRQLPSSTSEGFATHAWLHSRHPKGLHGTEVPSERFEANIL